MSSDPTRSPAAPPAPAAGLVDLVIARRAAVAWVLLGLGVVSGVACVLCVSRGLAYQTAAKDPAKKDAADPARSDADKEKDAEKKDDTVRIPPPHQTEYLIGAVTGLLGAITGLGLGAWLVAGLPPTTEAARRTQARVALLAAGGLIGLVLMFGAALFVAIPFFNLLVKWADTRVPPPGAWKVVVALLVFLLGAGLAFVAAQPARAEERTNPFLRRLVYGTNFALSTFLLVLVLFAGNVIAALKLPAQLDTTETGFYTLSDATKEYLAALAQPVTAYLIVPEEGSRVTLDIRRLLDAAQAVNPQKFQVRALSPVLNRNDIASLRSKYPSVDLSDFGVLLAADADPKTFAYIRYDEFSARNEFRGESVLAKELLGLTESKTRPVVYFTQNSGELAVEPKPDDAPKRAAGQLKAVLEKGFADARVWTLPPAGEAAVPADATVVVVADPTQPVPPRQADAIRKFMSTPRAEGKKGKLVVLSGTHAGPDGKVSPTGLEDVLAELKVRARSEFLYNEPLAQFDPETALAAVNPTLVRSRNSLALALNDFRVLPLNYARVIDPVRGADGPLTAEPLLLTVRGRISWVEPTRVDGIRVWEEMNQGLTQEAAARKQVIESSRSVGVIVSEGATPRAVVIGAGESFADQTGRRAGGSNPPADVFAAAVNWLRDRPPVANIANKTYGTYALSPDFDGTRGLWLPLFGIPLAVATVGLGVWVLRRA